MEPLPSSGTSRREKISRRLLGIQQESDPEARASFAIEVLDNALLGLQGPYFDLCPSDVHLLRKTLEEAGSALLNPTLLAKLAELERSTTLSFPKDIECLPVVRLQNFRVQWLHDVSSAVLLSMTCAPDHVRTFIDQHQPTAPPSADFELFHPLRVQEFLDRVSARCPVQDFKVGVVRSDLHFPSGAVWRDHPIHAISAFTHDGQLQLGSFFGSSSGLFLRHYKHVPFEYLHSAVTGLVLPVLQHLNPQSTTIGIPAPVRFDQSTGSWKPEDRPPSPDGLTYRTLCARPLGFELVTPRSFDEDGSISRHNHYFYRGPDHLWNDLQFIRIITTIREVRREMRIEAREGGGFVPVEIARDRVRKDWAREFLAHFFGVRN